MYPMTTFTTPYKLTTKTSNGETSFSHIVLARVKWTKTPCAVLLIKMAWIIAAFFICTYDLLSFNCFFHMNVDIDHLINPFKPLDNCYLFLNPKAL